MTHPAVNGTPLGQTAPPLASIPRAQLLALQAIRRAALAVAEAPYLEEHMHTLNARLHDYYVTFEKRS